jgi:hypothetical protein
MPEQRGGDVIRWPELLNELGKMESRIMAGVRETAAAAHTTNDRLDGRLLEHGVQHARDKTEHSDVHQSEWDAHHRQHDATAAAYLEERRNNQSRAFSSRGLYLAAGALLLQFATTIAAAVTVVIKQIH